MEGFMKNFVYVLGIALLPGLAIGADDLEWAYPATPKPAPLDNVVQKQMPGSAKQYTQAQIDDGFNPPDWFPDEHPPMPEIVANGKKPARACALCHLPTGNGHPESSSRAGRRRRADRQSHHRAAAGSGQSAQPRSPLGLYRLRAGGQHRERRGAGRERRRGQDHSMRHLPRPIVEGPRRGARYRRTSAHLCLPPASRHADRQSLRFPRRADESGRRQADRRGDGGDLGVLGFPRTVTAMTERYLEDFAVGQTFGSGGLRVGKERIKAFAAEFDPQPFHLDEEAARGSIFRGLAASGWHTAAMTMRLLVESDLKPAGGIVGAGFDEFRWPQPVRPGDELRVESEVLDVRPSKSRPEQGLIKVRTTTKNQNGEPVQVSIGNLVVPRRPA